MKLWVHFLALFLTAGLFSAAPSAALAKAREITATAATRGASCQSVSERAERLLKGNEAVLSRFPAVAKFLASAEPEERLVIGAMIALNQADTLFDGLDTLQDPQAALEKLAAMLVGFERFYQPIGGIVGYHATIIRLLGEGDVHDTREYFIPPMQDIRTENRAVWDKPILYIA